MTNDNDTAPAPAPEPQEEVQEVQEFAPTVSVEEVQGYVLVDAFTGWETFTTESTPTAAQEWADRVNEGLGQPGRFYLQHKSRVEFRDI